jgi:hypothetical protein
MILGSISKERNVQSAIDYLKSKNAYNYQSSLPHDINNRIKLFDDKMLNYRIKQANLTLVTEIDMRSSYDCIKVRAKEIWSALFKEYVANKGTFDWMADLLTDYDYIKDLLSKHESFCVYSELFFHSGSTKFASESEHLEHYYIFGYPEEIIFYIIKYNEETRIANLYKGTKYDREAIKAFMDHDKRRTPKDGE